MMKNATRIAVAVFVLSSIVILGSLWWTSRARSYQDVFGEPYQSNPNAENLIPAEGFIPDESVAIEIAKIYISQHLGKDVMKNQLPYEARILDGVWVVVGNVEPSWYESQKTGGRTRIELSKTNGSVVRFVPSE